MHFRRFMLLCVILREDFFRHEDLRRPRTTVVDQRPARRRQGVEEDSGNQSHRVRNRLEIAGMRPQLDCLDPGILTYL